MLPGGQIMNYTKLLFLFPIGLLPNTYYWVRVMAYNAAGPGPESERFLERTFKLRPQKPPTAVQVSNQSTYTLEI